MQCSRNKSEDSVDLKDSRNVELCSKATDVTLICIFTFILKEVASGKWLRLNNITFEDPKGQQRYIRSFA